LAQDTLSEVLSSPNSLGIAALVSVRPRTQSELVELTGVSLPGVLKHLKRLEKLGLVQEKKLGHNLFAARKVYLAKGMTIGDFSQADLRVVRLHHGPEIAVPQAREVTNLEFLAEDLILQERRVREQVRKLGRMIDGLLEDRSRLKAMTGTTGLGFDERLILQILFSEENVDDGERVLLRHFGLKGGRRSIDRVMAESKKIAKK